MTDDPGIPVQAAPGAGVGNLDSDDDWDALPDTVTLCMELGRSARSADVSSVISLFSSAYATSYTQSLSC